MESKKEFKDWEDFFRKCGLSEEKKIKSYSNNFKEEMVDLDQIPRLKEEDLKELKVKYTDTHKILKFIASINRQ